MEDKLNLAKQSLDDFYKSRKKQNDEIIKQAENYLEWTSEKTNMIKDEKNFCIPYEFKDKIKRGNVFWVNFGYNIDQEFGGKHPALILKRSPNMIIVAPLSSQEPSDDQKTSDIYVEVKEVVGFAPLENGKSRWINLLDIRSLSVYRIDFSSKYGYVRGYILDNINIGMNKIWRIFEPKNKNSIDTNKK